MTTAVSGATATSSANAERVLLRVAASSACPTENRNVTAAASQKLPIRIAPIAAIETSRSMPTTLADSARSALTTMPWPATTAAASISRSESRNAPAVWVAWTPASNHHCGARVGFAAPPIARSSRNEATIRAPESAGTNHFPVTHCCRRLTSSERRRRRLVAGLVDRGYQVVHRHLRGVVVDLDSRGRELHLHIIDAVDAADLLFDFLHARRAGKAFCAQCRAGYLVRAHDYFSPLTFDGPNIIWNCPHHPDTGQAAVQT